MFEMSAIGFRFRTALAAGAALAAIALPQGAGVAQSAGGAVQSISDKDKAEGAKAHPQLMAEFGGAETGPQVAYVETIGKNIAVQSGLSNARGDFTVTLLNSSVNNAFAIPGGYIYVTRQLVALMNNEAELAGVLGHEVGHVAARHAAKRQSAATRNQVIGVLGTILSGVLLGNGQAGQIGQQLFSQGSQLLTLKYSRGQETEADNLGVEYLRRAGYDPRAMSTVLASLAAQNALEARLMGSSNQVPAWASTHPDPASRVRAALARAGTATGMTNRDTFLTRISGLTYGDDPKQGVEGRKFTHPELAHSAPAGFILQNGNSTRWRSAGRAGRASFQCAVSAAISMPIFAGFSVNWTESAGPDRSGHNHPHYSERNLRLCHGAGYIRQQPGRCHRVRLSDWAANQAFHFLTIAPAGGAAVFTPMYNSMRRITAAEAAAIRPRKLLVVTTKKGDTVQNLAARMAYTDAQLDRFLVLNALNASSTITPGQKVKLVTY